MGRRMGTAALIVSAGVLISRILGQFREIIFASLLGANAFDRRVRRRFRHPRFPQLPAGRWLPVDHFHPDLLAIPCRRRRRRRMGGSQRHHQTGGDRHHGSRRYRLGSGTLGNQQPVPPIHARSNRTTRFTSPGSSSLPRSSSSSVLCSARFSTQRVFSPSRPLPRSSTTSASSPAVSAGRSQRMHHPKVSSGAPWSVPSSAISPCNGGVPTDSACVSACPSPGATRF